MLVELDLGPHLAISLLYLFTLCKRYYLSLLYFNPFFSSFLVLLLKADFSFVVVCVCVCVISDCGLHFPTSLYMFSNF